MQPFTIRRIVTGCTIGLIHFVVALYLTLGVLAAASKPISDPTDKWLLVPFFIVMFPACLLGFLGAYTNGFVALALVPLTSSLRAIAATRFLGCRYDEELLQVIRELPAGWKIDLFEKLDDGWVANISSGQSSFRLVSEWGNIRAAPIIDGEPKLLPAPQHQIMNPNAKQVAEFILQHST